MNQQVLNELGYIKSTTTKIYEALEKDALIESTFLVTFLELPLDRLLNLEKYDLCSIDFKNLNADSSLDLIDVIDDLCNNVLNPYGKKIKEKDGFLYETLDRISGKIKKNQDKIEDTWRGLFIAYIRDISDERPDLDIELARSLKKLGLIEVTVEWMKDFIFRYSKEGDFEKFKDLYEFNEDAPSEEFGYPSTTFWHLYNMVSFLSYCGYPKLKEIEL